MQTCSGYSRTATGTGTSTIRHECPTAIGEVDGRNAQRKCQEDD
jgi:hypothetical protein